MSRDRLHGHLAACLALAFLPPCLFAQSPPPSKDVSEPFVAWASGEEVVFRFSLPKIKAAKLTLEDLEIVRSMRFWKGEWKRKINDVEVDLQALADIEFRPLQVPPFRVLLMDGRQIVVTPRLEQIAEYDVTGESFQRNVVRALDDAFALDPEKTIVLRHLVVFGHLPHSTGPDKIHRSLGEPLAKFAAIKFVGKKGPQAAELSQMVAAYNAATEARNRCGGLSSDIMEKRFGPGRLTDKTRRNDATDYQLKSCRMEVHWRKDGTGVDYLYALHGKDRPSAKASEPEKLANEARALADAERGFLVEFLGKMRPTLTAKERGWIADLLERTQPILRWTDEERRHMLSDGPIERPDAKKSSELATRWSLAWRPPAKRQDFPINS